MIGFALIGLAATGQSRAGEPSPWIDQLLKTPYPAATGEPTAAVTLRLLRQDFEELETGRSVIKTPLRIGQNRFSRGLGSHSVGHLRVESPKPLDRFSVWIGVDHNERTRGGRGSVVFVVSADGRELFRSNVMRGGEAAQLVNVDLKGASKLDLRVLDAGDGPSCDHADWAEGKIVGEDGTVYWLDSLPRGSRQPSSRFPFSFSYDGRSSDELLSGWDRTRQTERIDDDRTRVVTRWSDPTTGLWLEWEAIRYSDFPAVEWMLRLGNEADRPTPILQDVHALNLLLQRPSGADDDFLLYRTNGAPSNPTDFEPSVVAVGQGASQRLTGGGGRSSNKDFPFFKVQAGDESYVVAVGWSGQWAATLDCWDQDRLHVVAGLEQTHFRLEPGECVRSPRILLLHQQGSTLEANAQFRRLIYKHYAARQGGRRRLPTLYCNTCFTRGGGWLNECTAENQISLIRAYAPLSLEALLTDAGWFEGGWPKGAGNWTPRKDAYPQGMGPVALAAESEGMTYGLWFEFERVMAGSQLHRNHPEWLLKSRHEEQETYLLDLGLPEVREHLFQIVRGFMELPGFGVYRSDFNINPLPYWRYTDAEDRQGVTEMRYIAGLYEFWDRIAETWPESLRIECASGGRRIDLETLMRMHVHQKSDFWFNNEVDQGSIWGLSQYLPNGLIMAPVNRLDDRSFHSAMATSLCLGWIADDSQFDLARARQLTERYHRVRHLLIGAWYPLLPYARDGRSWMASQYHRPDLDEGCVLVFTPLEVSDRTVEIKLHGLDPTATYELHYELGGQKRKQDGNALMNGFRATVPAQKKTELIFYRKTT